ncbi:MAG: hypothetical protein EPO22_02465 [Dehalococcoidia bacterium]|nr:MAG: hypothetical protein EPO22_02465 [Dehalococcoidia bacterium]
MRACHDLLKPGGRLAFATIYIRPDIDERAYRRAARARGRGVANRQPLAGLLRAAGFVDVRETDVTSAFARTTRAYLDTSRELSDTLRTEWGDQPLAQSRNHWRKSLAVTEEGILCRGIFSARRPVT